jgi:hypothetical protein
MVLALSAIRRTSPLAIFFLPAPSPESYGTDCCLQQAYKCFAPRPTVGWWSGEQHQGSSLPKDVAGDLTHWWSLWKERDNRVFNGAM